MYVRMHTNVNEPRVSDATYVCVYVFICKSLCHLFNLSTTTPQATATACDPAFHLPASPPVCPLSFSMLPTRWLAPGSCHSHYWLKTAVSSYSLWKALKREQSSSLQACLHGGELGMYGVEMCMQHEGIQELTVCYVICTSCS